MLFQSSRGRERDARRKTQEERDTLACTGAAQQDSLLTTHIRVPPARLSLKHMQTSADCAHRASWPHRRPGGDGEIEMRRHRNQHLPSRAFAAMPRKWNATRGSGVTRVGVAQCASSVASMSPFLPVSLQPRSLRRAGLVLQTSCLL